MLTSFSGPDLTDTRPKAILFVRPHLLLLRRKIVNQFAWQCGHPTYAQ